MLFDIFKKKSHSDLYKTLENPQQSRDVKLFFHFVKIHARTQQ